MAADTDAYHLLSLPSQMQVHELDVTQYGIVFDLKGNSDLHLSKRRICEKASCLMSSFRNQ